MSTRELELIDRNAAIEAVKHDLEWLGSRDGPAAVSALMRLPVIAVRYGDRMLQREPKEEADMTEAEWVEMPGYTDDRGRPRRDFGCSGCHCKWTTPEDGEPPAVCPFCGAAMANGQK